ncbi:Hypothetical protein NTJ_06641 [Nesidiocoris tenuis]|uniref:Uncharacterized protein n=1 Tax=Nesidiocoris tenuis TaxID=355587 RepID=A0ABN7ATT7_9HEMI|nr:Hypothetical protein NTJ_06641 [Nesidiocoris tenuis]
MKFILCSCSIFIISVFTSAQQLGLNSIGDFVGQLTNLINQNGGIGNLAQGLQQAAGPQIDNNGFGLLQRPGGPPILTGPTYSGQDKPYPPPGYYRPPYPGGHPGFVNALSSIVRYDDLKCVPRLLCEVTSGGKPGYAGQTASSGSSSKETLVALLTVLNFIDESPLLVFGRAALIGYTARGNPHACVTAYPTCPRDPDALVDYLNNHNGGFFRFFSGPPQQGYQPEYPQPAYPSQGYQPYPDQGYEPDYPQQGYGQYPPRPHKKRPYSYDLNQKPYYQDSAYRPDDPYSAYNYAGANNFYQERIQNRPYPVLSIKGHESPVAYQPSNYHYQGSQQVSNSDKLVFPGRTGKSVVFPQNDRKTYNSNKDFFPDRTGTGKLLLDSFGVHYSNNGPPDLVNFRDQRSVKFPSTMKFPFSTNAI